MKGRVHPATKVGTVVRNNRDAAAVVEGGRRVAFAERRRDAEDPKTTERVRP